MARHNKGKKRLVDCSVDCKRTGRHDFNVRPKPGETDREACLRRATDFAKGPDDCVTLRARGIDGIGSSKDDLTAAAARAQRTCRVSVSDDCREACREGIAALERELKAHHKLGSTMPKGRIIREG